MCTCHEGNISPEEEEEEGKTTLTNETAATSARRIYLFLGLADRGSMTARFFCGQNNTFLLEV